MKIFSNEEIRAIERYSIEENGISSIDLVERVAEGVSVEIISRWRPNHRFVVFAGWGNNGADAIATSRHLLEQGYAPSVYLFNIGGNRLSAECKASRDRLKEDFPDADLHEITGVLFEKPDLDSDCVVIDGLFGSGLNRPLPRGFQVLVNDINESGATIVSIDVPSGLFSDWNFVALNRNIIHANLTLAIQFPRLSFFMSDNAELVGEWKIIDIDLSDEAIRRSPFAYYLVQKSDARRILRPRGLFASKADFGTALICAGSYGMMGAAVLAARGCLRAGAGKVTCYAPRCGYYVMQSSVPSAMFKCDPNDVSISEISLQHDYNAVAIGPGIGTSDITIKALETFLKVANANGRAVLLDADALNCIALRPTMLNYLPVLSILTPHAGEFDRLFGQQPSAEARLKKAIEVSQFHNVFIVLKGRHTAIVRPDGKVYFNSSGTPAMATPGCGDVLTGIIAAFMAQGYKPEIAAIVGVYVHGVAGELAAAKHGTYGVTAEDIAANVGRAIKTIME